MHSWQNCSFNHELLERIIFSINRQWSLWTPTCPVLLQFQYILVGSLQSHLQEVCSHTVGKYLSTNIYACLQTPKRELILMLFCMWVLLEQIKTSTCKQAQSGHHHSPGTSAWIYVSENFLCEFLAGCTLFFCCKDVHSKLHTWCTAHTNVFLGGTYRE